MIDEMTLERALNMIVYGIVQRGEYPSPIPTIEGEILAKRTELKNLKDGKTERPETKIQYLNLVLQLEAQIEDLILENMSIIEQNRLDKKAVDDQFDTDILTAKNNTANKWAAVRMYRNSLLTNSDWTHNTDNKLTGGVKTAWKNYRQALRDVPQTYSNPDLVEWPSPPS